MPRVREAVLHIVVCVGSLTHRRRGPDPSPPRRKMNQDPMLFSRRPLAPEILNYAALDVITLLPVRNGRATDHGLCG